LSRQAKFFAAVSHAAEGLIGPDVLSVTPNLGENWMGDPAVFFLVILSDEASKHDLRSTTTRVKRSIVDQIEPLEEWDVIPYFDFRNQSEQADIDRRHETLV
jgi:hypothetical protein